MKKYIYIILFIVGFEFSGSSQNRVLASADASVKFMKFYPNPAISDINFEFQRGYDKSLSFQIYNFIGKKVFDSRVVTPKINIPLTDFYRGVYIYQLRDRFGKIIESGKFQVVK